MSAYRRPDIVEVIQPVLFAVRATLSARADKLIDDKLSGCGRMSVRNPAQRRNSNLSGILLAALQAYR